MIRRRHIGIDYDAISIVSPITFDPLEQNVNIFDLFSDYNNGDKAYVYSFSDTVNTLSLPVAAGISYHVGYTRGGVDTVLDGDSFTNPFVSGDTKRYVIVNSVNTNVSGTVPTGAIWVYVGIRVVNISSTSNTYIKYIFHNTTITSIVSGAFFGCTGLTGTLTIPSSVTSLGTQAFRGCVGITGNLILPASVTSIADAAFLGCTGFTGNLTIPTSVTAIGGFPFQDCTGLNGILQILSNNLTFPTNPISNTYLILNNSIGGNWEIYDKTLYRDVNRVSIVGSSREKTGLLNIPSTVITIGRQAFRMCTGLTGILTIPSSVTSLGSQSFLGCTGLTGNLTIPSSVTSIESSAFQGCTGFTGDLAIPTSITTLSEATFFGCTGLNGALTLHSGITALFNSPFHNCTNFTELNLQSGYNPPQANSNWFFNFSSNFTSDSLNQSILNIAGGGNTTRTITIGTTNKARLLAAYPNAVTDANARGITIV